MPVLGKSRNRKVRIAIVLTIAIVAAFISWRTNTPKGCEEGRKEIRDEAGKVTRIERTYCAKE